MPYFLQPLASPLSFALVALGAFLGITVGAIPGTGDDDVIFSEGVLKGV